MERPEFHSKSQLRNSVTLYYETYYLTALKKLDTESKFISVN